ncbi:iron-sulfur protein NUBPL-like [Uranotaenia lowii]|uniref:iron-sulfur protein NUBPL-like n=1 Tax=Uranotaenia lowii TaxID=190385 RepID=UPI002479527B|nr:iron-sulfur protein NUBPL-like [Uranotaenia lowii]XP_055597179.1 iron-sulfur protein NUBPL-like [Uranotaenia lowii]XP_055597180.1 iron-sulfur protein NUBPL-like [Uranotaenia lowii]
MLKSMLSTVSNHAGFFAISLRYFSSKPDPRQAELMARSLPKRKPLPGVRDIVVVSSGKGGVGKTTTAVNLAVSLASQGQNVGLMDGDIFGPSVPLMMNITESPLVDDHNRMIPLVNFGVKCISMGMLRESGPVVWRGPLVMSAIQRLLLGTVWDPLDILVVDTPPGTGDVHLSLSQNVPISGVVLVSTPQIAALEVTRKGAEMYRTLKVPLIGLVENMSHVICDKCDNVIELADRTTQRYADEQSVDILESIPIEKRIMQCGDSGTPSCLKFPDSHLASKYRTIGEKVIKFLENKRPEN